MCVGGGGGGGGGSKVKETNQIVLSLEGYKEKYMYIFKTMFMYIEVSVGLSVY